jgi:hypothetical protein
MKNHPLATRLQFSSFVALLLASACSGEDKTALSGLEPAPEALAGNEVRTQAGEQRPVEASLDSSGDAIEVTLRNNTQENARVVLDFRIDTPDGSFTSSEIEPVELLPGAETRVALPELEGGDRGAAWARVSLRYQFVLDGGITAAQMTELALQSGQVVPREEALATGRQLPDVVLEDDQRLVPKQAAPFSACFRNRVTFLPRENAQNQPVSITEIDLLQESTEVARVLEGQMYEYRAPNGAVGSGLLNASGCTASIARQTGNWTFKLYLYAERNTFSRGAYYQTDAGTMPFKEEVINVPATGNPARRDFLAAAADRNYQAAVFLSNHTMDRANLIGGLKTTGRNILRISPASGDGIAAYCHTVGGSTCTTAKTLRISSDIAHERGLVAHETGHWIHRMHHTATFNRSYDYSDADAGNPADDCIRDSPNQHVADSVEWQSAAHLEGIADFFAAVAFNNVTSTADCAIPFYIGFGVEVSSLDCEEPGESMSDCAEWTNTTLFHKTGNELDWTKMYWDFATNRAGSIPNLMAAEAAVTSWPAQDNHYDRVANLLSSTQRTKLNGAAGGNIFEGVDQ